jgi:cyanophycin synthetase
MLVKLAERLDVVGRRLVVLSAPGDRRDVDIYDIGRIAAGKFDLYVCRRDDHRRGRGHDEVPLMLRQGLLERGVPDEQIVVIPSEQEATDYVLRAAEPGDLLLLFGDALTRTWKQIISFTPVPGALPAAARETDPNRIVPAPDLPDLGDALAIDGDQLVRDERGVRLAREPEPDD